MRRKLIGKKVFKGTVDITDPCYDKDVWCRTNVVVKDGTYDCMIWKQTEKVEYEGKIHNDTRVGIIGIYLNGIIPRQRSMEEIGVIGVDAGLAGFFMDKPDYTEDQWQDICDMVYKGDAWITDDGFFSSSGWGDGSYGVYAYKESGEIVALEIRFM